MYVPFDTLPEESKIWIYQSNRKFSDEEIQDIEKDLTAFLENWTSHGQHLEASFVTKYNRFIIIAVNQEVQPATGCSIDASVQFIQNLEQKYGVDLLDKMNVTFKMGEHVAFKPLIEFKKLSKEGRDWKELLNNEENILKKTTDNLNKINNELKTETQDYHKENKTINKLEKFFKSIPESLISYNNQVQEKINKQSELKEYEEIIEIIQNEIKTTDNIEEKKNHLNDFIALKKDHKTIKNEIDSINLNLKNLRQDAQKNLNEAKFSLKQVDKELYRKIKQENYIKSTITRINEDIVDKTINLFNNSIYLASQATKLSVNLLTKGTEKLKNLFTKSKEQPNKTSKKINKDDLVR